MRHISFILIILFSCSGLFAQNKPFVRCGTMKVLERKLKQDPNFAARIRAKQDAANARLSLQRVTTDTSEILIPVVVHVVYRNSQENISDTQVLSQIDILNQDFRRENPDSVNTPAPFVPVAGRFNIRFKLANTDPNGNASSGITRTFSSRSVGFYDDDSVKFTVSKGVNAWNTKHYLNLWVCKMEGDLLGYGQFADDPDTLTDGVVVNYLCFGNTGTVQVPFDKGRTLTHELGHWLNLYHIWGDATCGNDLVNDTPTQRDNTFGCIAFPHYSCGNDTTGLKSGDMFMNYMDYSDDACMNIFTQGQVDRMKTTYNTYRYEFVNSNGVGINEKLVAKNIFVYPNPINEGKFTIQLPNNGSGKYKLVIRNILGAIVLQQEQNLSGGNLLEVNASNIKSGVYILQIFDEKQLLLNDKILFN